jgi:hypothetical protein
MATYSINVSITATAGTEAEALALSGLTRYVRANAGALGLVRSDVAGLTEAELREYAGQVLHRDLIRHMLHDITVSADEAREGAIAAGSAAGTALSVSVEEPV